MVDLRLSIPARPQPDRWLAGMAGGRLWRRWIVACVPQLSEGEGDGRSVRGVDEKSEPAEFLLANFSLLKKLEQL